MENNTDSVSGGYDDEIDLRELFGVLWAGKVEIVVGVLLSALIAGFLCSLPAG
jgi:LPS O-antigen subunit length determinant protein (WzzB/FepE family)